MERSRTARASATGLSFSARVCAPLLVCASLGLPAPVRADWVEASSDHFVVYSEQDPDAVRKFSERLELYHAAMGHLFPRQQTRPSPSNRVTIFVVPNMRAVRKLGNMGGSFVAGFYRPDAGRTVAVVSTVRSGGLKEELTSEEVLFHEYAHHVMWGVTHRTFPRWYVEGFAETFAGVRFDKDVVALGAPAHHRKYGLQLWDHVRLRALLAFDGGGLRTPAQVDVFYGKAWALFHYLLFDPARAGQLRAYEKRLAAGDGAIEAAEAAFGDLARLQRDLEDYVLRRSLRGLSIPRSELPVGTITVRRMSAGESAIMPVRMQSSVGVTEQQAQEVVVEARRIAAQYPSEAAVLAALAEAEFDAGGFDAAIAAAERALAIDPRQINAFLQKGFALEEKLRSSDAPAASWKEVRSHWAKANRAENNHPIPLAKYYQAFLEEGAPPTPTAVKGLEWALALAPFDQSLRWTVAQQMIWDGRLAEAALALGPLAYSPHPGEGTERARQLLAEVEGKLGRHEAEADPLED